jgi:GTP-binding protein
MKFVDEASIAVRGGNGGAGCVSLRREKYRPKGGPDGGNGGDGGNVVFRVDTGLSTRLDLKFQRRGEAENGEPGRGKDQHGKGGEDRIVCVPLGTVVRDIETAEIIADLDAPDAQTVVAQGGRGGRGNATYATSTNQAPRRSQPGTPGEARQLRLELHLMADVGLVGFPNVGKSTLIARVSAARPRIADYPFTTLAPNLGVVRWGDDRSFVLADIPGLIEGAHTGQGLGLRFLRHVSRTTLLIHLLDAGGLSGRDPLDDFDTINRELGHFDSSLAAKPQIVVGNKIDLLDSPVRIEELIRRFDERGIHLWPLSAVTGEGVRDLIQEAGSRLQRMRQGNSFPEVEDTSGRW